MDICKECVYRDEFYKGKLCFINQSYNTRCTSGEWYKKKVQYTFLFQIRTHKSKQLFSAHNLTSCLKCWNTMRCNTKTHSIFVCEIDNEGTLKDVGIIFLKKWMFDNIGVSHEI